MGPRASSPHDRGAGGAPLGENGGVLVAFSITPIGAGESVSEQVADVVRLVRESGLPNETNSMFTNVEGEWDEVMALLKRCTERVAESAGRVSLVIKVDYRPGVNDALTSKVRAVEARLGGAGEGASP